MKHLDLFSGIGGFALAVDTVWPGSEHIFCDNDPFCQQLLKKHWPNSKIYGDIRQLNSDTYGNGLQEQGTEQQASGDRQLSEITFLTGGFPCQPFSQVGKRGGTEDNRYLWPEMLRVIQTFKPTYVIAENVRGLLTINNGLVFEQVCLDLEASGYEVQPFIIPAVAVNAPHRRDRLWFVAYSKSKLGERSQPERSAFGEPQTPTGNGDILTPDSQSGEPGEQAERQGREDFSRGDWEANWLEVATELCGVDDGLPVELDGFELTKAGHRTQRLKALGNSIVPQVAIQIMQAIKQSIGQSLDKGL